MSDKIRGLIGPLEGKGHGRVTRRYALVFTDHELICVKIGGTLSLFTSLVGEAVAEGYGLSTITDVYTRILGRRVDALKAMQVQDLVDADPLNFAIPYPDLETIEVKKRSRLSPRGQMTLDFATKNKSYWFRIVETSAYTTYVNLVKTIISDQRAR